jgi:hypothetical protein
MSKYIIKFLLRYIVKHLKFLSKYINYSIKYLSRSNRFSTFKKRIKFIKGIIIYLKSTKLYKIYKIYNTSIKIIAFLNLLLVLSFTKFQIKIEIDYIAYIAFITSIFNKIINKLGIDGSLFKEIFNYIHNFFRAIIDKNNTTTSPTSIGSIAEGSNGASPTNASAKTGDQPNAPLQSADCSKGDGESDKEPISDKNLSRRD